MKKKYEAASSNFFPESISVNGRVIGMRKIKKSNGGFFYLKNLKIIFQEFFSKDGPILEIISFVKVLLSHKLNKY